MSADPSEPCPRCERSRAASDEACAQCGLLVSRWPGFDPGAGDPPGLEALWATCAATWLDVAAHDRLLQAASLIDGLPGLARRYRLRAKADPDDEMARRRLQKVVVMAEHAARAQVVPFQALTAMRAAWYLGHVLGVLGVLAVGYMLLRVLGRR
ncbi:MAG: hypothetical protein EXR72_18960 [Myxococcales bacterium]|nr:hypothetical protein [Myxococcales bacterium]